MKKPTPRAKKWLTEEGLTLIKGWAMNGLSDEQIAKNMGIASSTFYLWKKDYSEISEALKRSKEVVDLEVENALHQAAINGNTTAMIFWLKNRRPQHWRDRVEHDHNAEELSKVDKILKSIDKKMED